MRRGVMWALIAAVAASAWVLLTPPEAQPGHVVPAAGLSEGTSRSAAVAANRPLPTRWEAPLIEPAKRNPFAVEVPPAPVAKAPPAPAPKIVVPQPAPALAATAPPPQVAAPFPYRYLGRMVDPAGQRVVYVARGDNVVVVQPGLQLQDGYVVEAIHEARIEFVNTATQQRQTIAIPPDAGATASAANARTQ